jgi:hypothetical protein
MARCARHPHMGQPALAAELRPFLVFICRVRLATRLPEIECSGGDLRIFVGLGQYNPEADQISIVVSQESIQVGVQS